MVGAEGAVGPQGQVVDDGDGGAEGGVVEVGEEVGVLEVAEHEEVYRHAGGHEGLAARLRGRGVHAYAEPPAQQGGEDEQQHEEPRGLVVEQKADGEEVAVARHAAVACQGAVGAENCVDGEDDEEEGPEVYLCEQQGMGAVEAEELR